MLKRILILAAMILWFVLTNVSTTYSLSVRDIIAPNPSDEVPSHLVEPPEWDYETAEWFTLYLIAKVIDILLFFAWTISLIILIIGWFQYIIYFWVEENATRAKSLIINSLIGLVIVICSALIVENADRLIRFLIGG